MERRSGTSSSSADIRTPTRQPTFVTSMARSETKGSSLANQPPNQTRAIGAALLPWYRAHRRDLPWRQTRDPYAIWVSEVMLQQTQVETVRPYYARWLARFPDIAALAAASESEVLLLWQGLGYYSRARRLLAGAQAVAEKHGGALPESVDELLRLPGIGPYSAGAIASIAFNQEVPLVDGNVVRVITRLFGLHGDPSRAPLKSRIWELAAQLIVKGHARDFNQALMELGATVCTPQKPLCLTCPVRGSCEAARRGLTQILPELPKRQPPTQVAMLAAFIVKRGRYLVYKVPDSAPRWAGMWQFPNIELEPAESPRHALSRLGKEQLGLKLVLGEHASRLQHSVTRYRITLDVYDCTVRETEKNGEVKSRLETRWCLPKALAGVPMPAVHQKLAGIVMGRANRRC